MRKKLFFSATVVVLMLLVTSSTAFAQSLKLSDQEAQLITTEIRSGEPIKKILERHRITFGQIKEALASAGFTYGKKKITPAAIALLTKQLGLQPDLIREEIEAGKTFREILSEHQLSDAALQELLRQEMKNQLDRE